ncbi:MAG TPA: hypothetical protein VLT57_16210, partial [Bryobacteraceae bacterium]|nr:hypothetical protein [Bryobacteraceae bacterium]
MESLEACHNGGAAGFLKSSTTVDGLAEVAEKGDTRGAGIDVVSHLLAGGLVGAAVQEFREVGEDFATVDGSFCALAGGGCGTLAEMVFGVSGGCLLEEFSDGEASAME